MLSCTFESSLNATSGSPRAMWSQILLSMHTLRLLTTHRSVSSSSCKCISQSPPSFLSLDTCHPLLRVFGSLCTCTLVVVESFRINSLIQCTVACILQYVHLRGIWETALIQKNWQVWPPARKGWWMSVKRASQGSLSQCELLSSDFKLLKRRATNRERERD